MALAAFLLPSSSAAADLSFCPQGSGAGQCEEARGVAADSETGRVFVADTEANRIDAFASDGEFLFAIGWGVIDGAAEFQKCTTLTGCQKGIAGAGVGQFNAPRRVAVDNNALSGSRHDVYVFDSGNFRVQKFAPDGTHLLSFGSFGTGPGQFALEVDPLAVGPGGVVYVGDTLGKESEGFTPRVEKFEPGGGFIEAVALAHLDLINGDLEVDSAGDIYGTFNKGGGAFKFHPNGIAFDSPYPLDAAAKNSALSLAVDNADNLYVSQSESRDKFPGTFNVITAYSAAGNHLARFGYGGLKGSSPGLALFSSAAGDVFASGGGPSGQLNYLSVPSLTNPGPIAAPPSLQVSAIGNTKATLKAEINPEGKATQYHFDYVDQQAFEEQGGFEGPATKSTETAPLPFPAGKEFQLQGVQATIGCANATEQLIEEGKCLLPETQYRFRVVATNADNLGGGGEARSEGPLFKTLKAIEIEELYATAVGTDVATLHTKVNPLGIPAGGYFEYVDDAAYQADIAKGPGHEGFEGAVKVPDPGKGEQEIDFGGGEGGITRAATIGPLKAGTLYHYRLAAKDALLADTIFFSEAKTLSTFAVPATPPCPANAIFRTATAALLPDCRAYEMVSPIDKEGGDIKVQPDLLTTLPAVVNQSAVSGAKLSYGSYRSFGGAASAPYTSQYIAARGAGGWESRGISAPRGQPVLKGFSTFENEFKLFSADLCEGWMQSFAEPILAPGAVETFTNLYRWADPGPGCGGTGFEALTKNQPQHVEPASYLLELQGTSADGAVAIFAANDNLVSPAPSLGGGPQLFASAGGQTRFVCILPNGTASPAACTAGGTTGVAFGNYRRVRIDNAIAADGKRIYWSNAAGAIYLRENPFAEEAECAGPEAPCSVAVSAGGEALSGKSGSQYWGAAQDGSAAVYSTGDFSGGHADLYSFEPEGSVTTPIAAEVFGVVGMSADATRIYVVSGEVKDGGALAGAPNLYLYESGGGGSFRFIASLSGADVSPSSGLPKEGSSATAVEPWARSVRVSPDGLHLALMSTASLTGYDNTDASSGKADREVFLYDAGANSGAGKLICASCNPGGGRPQGENVATENNANFWVAARIPVWENSLYAARALSADGTRLYFESLDALSSRDTNGQQDVYQWEQSGSGGCEETSSSFSAASGAAWT